jgi:hypothetical protein
MINGKPTLIAHAGAPTDFRGRSTDPGSDDLILSWDWGDGPPEPDVTTIYYVNPPTPDPLPSPSIQPRDVTDTKTHAFGQACWYVIGFRAEDDDGGWQVDSADVIILGNADLTRSAGYWRQQYRAPQKSALQASLTCYLKIVGYMSTVFDEVRDASTPAKAAAVLSPKKNEGDMRVLLDQQLLALWLNFANGSVGWEEWLDTDADGVTDATLASVMTAAETVRLDPSATNAQLEAQKDILERINLMDEK